MPLELTYPLSEMITRNISLGGGEQSGRCVRLTTFRTSCVDFLGIWEPQPPATLRACPGLQWYWFTLLFRLVTETVNLMHVNEE